MSVKYVDEYNWMTDFALHFLTIWWTNEWMTDLTLRVEAGKWTTNLVSGEMWGPKVNPNLNGLGKLCWQRLMSERWLGENLFPSFCPIFSFLVFLLSDPLRSRFFFFPDFFLVSSFFWFFPFSLSPFLLLFLPSFQEGRKLYTTQVSPDRPTDRQPDIAAYEVASSGFKTTNEKWLPTYQKSINGGVIMSRIGFFFSIFSLLRSGSASSI